MEKINRFAVHTAKHEAIKQALCAMGVQVLEKLPEGWRYNKYATTAPEGYKWANNGKDYFSGAYENALIKIDEDGVQGRI